MVGTDLYGTVLDAEKFTTEPRVCVRWDYITPENGEVSWIKEGFVVLVAVPKED